MAHGENYMNIQIMIHQVNREIHKAGQENPLSTNSRLVIISFGKVRNDSGPLKIHGQMNFQF